MRYSKPFFLAGMFLIMLSSCSKEDIITDSKPSGTQNGNTTAQNPELEVENFIYNGLNEIYLYKSSVPELADNYFGNSNEKNDFLASSSSPESLFKNLLASVDRFSFITDDFNSLEERFQGTSGATGIKFGVGQISNTGNVFGFIRYILPGTSAANAGLKRGNIFTEIDGQKLTPSNFERLINKNEFTINVGYVEDNQIIMTNEVVRLTDNSYTENPVFITKTYELEGQKIGYLMYNSFTGNFDDELNAAFGEFKAEGITNLILDLRYNGGGSVESAKDLASMITGQFEGEIFMKEQWNEKYQAFYEAQSPESLINRFDNSIRTGEITNSLFLNEVYVLTSGSSASASELIINGLEPYINVKQIGDRTVGKFQASVTLYDSEDFGKTGASKNHTYAMQPLVFKSINANGKTDFVNGLDPDIKYVENLNDMGVLGETDEPLLNLAINDILGRTSQAKSKLQFLDYTAIGESGMNEFNFQRMYIDELPTLK
ncbi:S41 family peptidase [Christiangramia aquimixticola]|uniref:S41 family peptidase n=1 Tax=Christiangramia aquimixticola TaxID=1697558 RepID=UPI003AA7FE21